MRNCADHHSGDKTKIQNRMSPRESNLTRHVILRKLGSLDIRCWKWLNFDKQYYRDHWPDSLRVRGPISRFTVCCKKLKYLFPSRRREVSLFPSHFLLSPTETWPQSVLLSVSNTCFHIRYPIDHALDHFYFTISIIFLVHVCRYT